MGRENYRECRIVIDVVTPALPCPVKVLIRVELLLHKWIFVIIHGQSVCVVNRDWVGLYSTRNPFQ
jgi:hypothetical protein